MAVFDKSANKIIASIVGNVSCVGPKNVGKGPKAAQGSPKGVQSASHPSPKVGSTTFKISVKLALSNLEEAQNSSHHSNCWSVSAILREFGLSKDVVKSFR